MKADWRRSWQRARTWCIGGRAFRRWMSGGGGGAGGERRLLGSGGGAGDGGSGCGGGCDGVAGGGVAGGTGTCSSAGSGGGGPLGGLASGGGSAGAGLVLPPPPLAATALVALLLLAIYRLSACPGPDPPFALDKSGLPAPAYLLLLPGNASSLPPPYPLHQLPAGDRDALIDVRPFAFRSPGPAAARACGQAGSDAPLLLVLVHSAPANALKRTAIRDTWASPAILASQRDSGGKARGADGRMRVLFLLGTVDSEEEQGRIDQENALHGDIVQGSFRDSYRNMTYKHVMALKWAAYRCPGARYLLKTDDDVFVNSPALLRFLARELSPWGARRLILCKPFPYAYVKRSWRSKWRVSPKEYPGRMYPRYCAGWAVLYSPDAVFLLYREAQRTPYFWIDDVHVTGTLAARANLSQTPIGSLALTEVQVAALLALPPPAPAPTSPGGARHLPEPSAPLPPYAHTFLFGAPDLRLDRLYALWALVQRAQHES